MISKIALVLCCLGFALPMPMKKIRSYKYSPCPDGWVRFKESCYFIENKRMGFQEAETSCLKRGAAMFVPDTVEEWVEVIAHTPLNYWTWSGLRYDSKAKRIKWRTSEKGLAVEKLDWLNSLATTESNGISSGDWVNAFIIAEINGMSPVASCVGHYNCDVGKSYNFYYHCDMDFYSVCERNATLLKKPADNGF